MIEGEKEYSDVITLGLPLNYQFTITALVKPNTSKHHRQYY